MIKYKHLSKISIMLILFSLLICGLIVYHAHASERPAQKVEYESRLFGDEVIALEILTDESNWQYLLNNAEAKPWISVDLIVNGERFSNVGIRTKGNSTLSGRGGDRYSLQIKFNKYVKGQTYYGLDAFCVNNMSGDSTYMKDYLAYDIMSFIGVEAPLKNFANVSVNGEHYSFGVALERYEKAYLGRAYSTSAGQLYSVKIGFGMRQDFEDLRLDDDELTNMRQEIQNIFVGNVGDEMQFPEDFNPEDMAGMFGGGFPNMPGGEQQGGNDGFGNRGGFGGGMFGGRGGGSLQYTDDNISSYSAIFDNAEFNPTDKDKQRVITAIENLNNGTDLEKYLDVDQILRYFAAHTVVVNADSYTSNMQQNYYIYERDGKISILPWDYGLAFGSFMSGSASSSVNFPIDTPVSGVNMEDRPLLNKLLEVDEYRERYHGYLQEIIEGYFESGRWESTIKALDERINEYVKNDTTTTSTYEQYENALPTFIEFGNLRAESIRGQLEGTIPSTTDGQRADGSALVDASHINMSLLGSMGGGGMRGGDNIQNGQNGQDGRIGDFGAGMPDGQEGQFGGFGEGMPPDGRGEMPEGGQFGGRGGDMPQGGRRGEQGGQFGGFAGGGMPDMSDANNRNTAPARNSAADGIIVLIGLVLLLGGAIMLIAKSRR
jgi:spore coat protein CotH